MSAALAREPLGALYPPGIERLRVAWRHLRVPGPPLAFALTAQETAHPDPAARFARRTIQCIGCTRDGETLALIDKASPHSRLDLMLSEISPRPRSTAVEVDPRTGRLLWTTGYRFVEFCSQPRIAAEFGLAGGELHLALNCDPHTCDRESVQAAKQFHLHLLYWDRIALQALATAAPLGREDDRRLLRQSLDPLGFLGARLIGEALGGLELGIAGARLLAPDDSAAIRGERPLGCIVRLPGWSALLDPGFEPLIRRIHERLETLAGDLLEAFAGARSRLPPWQRHPLLPLADIRARLAELPCSATSRDGLAQVAERLRSLAGRTAARLARAGPARRMDLMGLNLPAYTLNLYASRAKPGGGVPLHAPMVDLILQPRFFSGIGGAGLLTLGGVPSVRILRGQGRFSAQEWAARARFQRCFARFNRERLDPAAGLAPGPIRRFSGTTRGWV